MKFVTTLLNLVLQPLIFIQAKTEFSSWSARLKVIEFVGNQLDVIRIPPAMTIESGCPFTSVSRLHFTPNAPLYVGGVDIICFLVLLL